MSATSGIAEFRQVAVLGGGLIGGAIALRLHQAGVAVRVWDPSQRCRAALGQVGLDCRVDLAEAVASADLVFLAAPLRALAGLLDEVMPLVGDGCVVTDVGSTKSAVIRHVRERGLGGRFVGGHPMAGGPSTGFDTASGSLLVDAVWALSVDDGVDLAAFRGLANFLMRHFSARVVPVGANQHDEATALVSHFPHLLAAVLTNVAAGAPTSDLAVSLAAASFQRGTLSAASAPYRSTAMVWENRAAVRHALGLISAALAEAELALQWPDDTEVGQIFDRAFRVKANLAAAAGAEPYVVRFTDMAVELAFLRCLGSGGGFLTRCEAAGDTVIYECGGAAVLESPDS